MGSTGAGNERKGQIGRKDLKDRNYRRGSWQLEAKSFMLPGRVAAGSPLPLHMRCAAAGGWLSLHMRCAAAVPVVCSQD